MKKVCIVGCGTISNSHRNAIIKTENAELYAACDTDTVRLKAVEKEWGVITYNSFSDVLKDEKIDSVHICTPHYLHYEMITKALEAGKKVVCEKPVTMTKEQFNQLLCNKHAENVCVVQQNRLNLSIQTLKKIADSGELGKIVSMKAFLTWRRDREYYRIKDWRGKLATAGGGVLINQAIHTLDYFSYIAGGIESVRADMFNYSLDGIIEVEDTVSAYLGLKNNAKGIFFATNTYSKNPTPHVEIVFENGEAVYTDGKLLVNGELLAEDTVAETGKKYWGTGHNLLIENFYDNNIFFSIYDVKNTMDAVFAMYESAKIGKAIKL